MSAFYPIAPLKAVEFVEAAGVSGGRRLIADFAAAGMMKSYALVIETIEVGGARHSVRDSTVSSALWDRIIRAGLVDEVWTGGTVRLPAAHLVGGEPEVRITGIRFSEKHLGRLVEHHTGAQAQPAPAVKAPEAAAIIVDESHEPTATPTRRQPDLNAIPPGALTVTVSQAQAALGLGRTKINELMNDGRLVRRKIDRSVRIEVASIYALIGIAS